MAVFQYRDIPIVQSCLWYYILSSSTVYTLQLGLLTFYQTACTRRWWENSQQRRRILSVLLWHLIPLWNIHRLHHYRMKFYTELNLATLLKMVKFTKLNTCINNFWFLNFSLQAIIERFARIWFAIREILKFKFQWKFSNGESDSDRKSTRLNSSHLVISYAVFCLKKKKKKIRKKKYSIRN